MAGHTAAFVKRIEREMYAASEAQDYEKAARLRDDLGALNRALEKQAVVLGDGTDADVVAVEDDPLEVAVQIFHVRGGRVRGQRGWVAEKTDDADLGGLVERFLQQLYAGESRGRRAARDPRARPARRRRGARDVADRPAGEPGQDPRPAARRQEDACRRRWRATPSSRWRCTRPGARRTSPAATRRSRTSRTALDLPEAPLRIECYDISNLQGTEVVASMVVFEDGLARKSEYRRFVIRSVEGQNDVAAMHEVITRRFRRLLDERVEHPDLGAGSGEVEPVEAAGPMLVDPDTGRARKFAYAPGLVVVDGGPPQVAAAQRALDELGIDDVPVCGLAKRLEEIWLPGQEDPVVLPRTSEALFLLQRLRDEAHRFAITHHRSRRSKSMVESLLDDVPGLGEVRRKALLRRFGSLRKIRAATVEEIAEVPGIGPAPPRRSRQRWPSSPAAGGRSASTPPTGEIEES